MPKARNYKQEYATQHASPKAKKQRAERNRARRKLKKKGVNMKGKDAGHSKKGAKGSVRAQSVKSNRSHGGKIGNRAGKARGARITNAKRRRG